MEKHEFEKLDKLYLVPDNSMLYAISPRLGKHLAERFRGKTVIECCTGAGFLTIELAKVARHVFTIERDKASFLAAQHNVSVAGMKQNVTFIHGDALNPQTFAEISGVNAAILDPVWGKTPHDMSPPADTLVYAIQAYTKNIALILPPFTEQSDIDLFFPDELERLYLDGTIALLCLYTGTLAKQSHSEFKC